MHAPHYTKQINLFSFFLNLTVDEEEREEIRGFDAALLSGKADTLRRRNSEVSIETPERMQNILCRKIHTDLSRHEMNLPHDESIIGPTVEVQLAHGNEENQKEFILRIPHCLEMNEVSAIKVRCIDDKRKDSVRYVVAKEQAMGTIPYFETNSSHVIIHTNHFSEYVCSSSSDDCLTSIMAFPFGSMWKIEKISHVKVKVYLCCSLFKIQDFKTVSTESRFINVYDNMFC